MDTHDSEDSDHRLEPTLDGEVTGEFVPSASAELSDGPTNPIDAQTLDGTSKNAAESQQPASDFGDYQLLEEIARGGMGVVYRASQKSLDREVALKMILAGELASEEDVRRFYAEAEAAAKLDHANIVPIYEIGKQQDTHYFSMKLIEGSDLGHQLSSLRKDLRAAIAILEKVCLAVAHAHQRGVLHRDLKPANILLDHDHEPYVTDLGLARNVGSDSQITKTGAVVGTPSYMSPEQASGQSDLTTASDVYSLGAILYEVLTGAPPFRGKTPMETIMKVISDEPSRPSLTMSTDRSLELVALKCLEKSPNARYASALELARDLRRWLNGEPLAIRAPSISSLTKNWMRQNFGRAPWILGVGLISGLLSGFSLWNATVQRESTSYSWVYEQLPSVEQPVRLMNWSTPDWMVIPSFALLIFSLLLLGYFTALFVQTKNTNADIVAGLAVGVIAAAGAFFFSMANLGISASIDRTDLNLLGLLADSPTDETPMLLIDAYPEFQNMDRDLQIRLLKQKITVERDAAIPRGLGLSVIACFAQYVLVGLAGTLIAGRALRRKGQRWWRALLEYLFRSLPFVILLTFISIHLAVILIFRASGIVYDWLTLSTIVMMLLGVLGEVLHWKLAIRVFAFGCSLVAFASFCTYDFDLLPDISPERRQLQANLRKVEQFPGNPRLHWNAAGAYQTIGVSLYHANRLNPAIKNFQLGISYIEDLPSDELSYDLDRLLRTGYSNQSETLKRQNRLDEALALWTLAAEKHPSNRHIQAGAIQFLCENGRTEAANRLFDDYTVTSPESLRVIKHMAFALDRAIQSSVDEDSADFKNTLDRLQSHASLKTNPQQAPLLAEQAIQTWLLICPGKPEHIEAIQAELLDGSFEVEPWERRGAKVKTTSAFAPLETHLTDLFPDAGDHTAAFAFGILRSSEAQEVSLAFGSDDGFRLWLNSKFAAEHTSSRPFAARDDLLPVALKSGANHILIRIDQTTGPWAFGLQVDRSDGWPATITWDREPSI